MSEALDRAHRALKSLDDATVFGSVNWWRTSAAVLARAVIDQDEELTALRKIHACPCQHTTPCHERCTCVTPLSSSGCRRCCTYGSAEQRKAKAERLASQAERIEKLEAGLREALEVVERYADYAARRRA